jgi:REP element-mobilizing transposase RayT
MSKYHPDIHHRRSIRLRNYDYSQKGLYFITICVQNHECFFGNIVNGEMILNEMGKIAYNEWIKTPEIRPEIELGEFVVMPNHFHAIVNITRRRGVSHTPSSHTHQQSGISVGDVCNTSQSNTSITNDDALYNKGVCDNNNDRGVCEEGVCNRGVCDITGAYTYAKRAYAIRPYGRHQTPLARLCEDINRRFPNKWDFPCGNAVITSILYATTMITHVLPNIL